MRRLAIALGAVLALAGAPVALADGNDPRCADWLQHGPPPGVDLGLMCPDRGLMLGEVPLADEPLVPYIIGLLVMAAVLTVVGFIAMRAMAPRRRQPRPADWWPCPACGEANLPDRATCFACQASKGPGTPATSASRADAEPLHPG
jgi:hypothetical protein